MPPIESIYESGAYRLSGSLGNCSPATEFSTIPDNSSNEYIKISLIYKYSLFYAFSYLRILKKMSILNNRATVVKHTGSHYLLSPLPEWRPFPAVIRGKLRIEGEKTTNPVAVGDIVEYRAATATSPGTADVPSAANSTCAANTAQAISNASRTPDEACCVITKVLPRRNCIIRRAANLSRQSHIIAANIDMAYLVITIDFPEIKQQFIDRFLVTCQAYQVPVTIIINKMDLYGEEQLERVRRYEEIYTAAGYRISKMSALDRNATDLLREECKGRICLFSGQSGVGKSSIIMALDPSLDLKTQEISDAHLQGKHTTTFYQMHPLSNGGFVVDTPGIRGFGLVNVAPEELSNYFPEMFKIESECRFTPCTHTHEPGCAVKAAVESGEIAWERYDSYLGMLDEDEKYRK